MQAALALLAVLEAENAALEATDLAGAATLLGRKQQAADQFAASVAEPARIPAELGGRLREASARNRVLLERGLEVQGRVLAIVAGAARPAGNAPARYGGGGRLAARAGAVVLSLRA